MHENIALRLIIKGEDAATILSTLIGMGLVSQLDHAAYLGRELARAEMSLDSDIKYVQDKAQGEIQSQVEIIDLILIKARLDNRGWKTAPTKNMGVTRTNFLGRTA